MVKIIKKIKHLQSFKLVRLRPTNSEQIDLIKKWKNENFGVNWEVFFDSIIPFE